MSEEIKVVILFKGNRGSIGIQSPDCDPLLATFEGDLKAALEKVPRMVDEANAAWDKQPKYPRCQSALPQPVARPAAAPAASAQRQQPSMF